eukprot:scaffold113911_cov17-Prasinocladus_malaysianus.AAC.1
MPDRLTLRANSHSMLPVNCIAVRDHPMIWLREAREPNAAYERMVQMIGLSGQHFRSISLYCNSYAIVAAIN